MKKYDISFNGEDINLIKNMAGKCFEFYRADPFLYSASVYGEIGIVIEGKAYSLSNFVQPLHYYGAVDDVGIFKISEVDIKDIKSQLDDTEMVDRPVNQKIVGVTVVNETQELYKNDEQIYEYKVTRGLIFEMEDGAELSFEKDVWFSEDIIINKGYNLLEKFTDVQEFENDWKEKEGYTAKCIRKTIYLAES